MNKYELRPVDDTAKSFYKKANVTEEDGIKTLTSYTTEVAQIINGKAFVSETYSNTTLRHIKEFLKQNGFKAETKSQILDDYSSERPEEKSNNDILSTASKVALMGNILFTEQKEKNDFKKRMLKATGLPYFPDDWDDLTEDEKERRLNEVIKMNMVVQ